MQLVLIKSVIAAVAFGPYVTTAREVRAEKVAVIDAAAFEDRLSENPDRGNPPLIGVAGAYNPDEVPIWDGESRLPKWVSVSLATLWVTMVASLPLLIVKAENEKITAAQWRLFIVMWFAFFGGVWLFTNIILFQSVHFKQIRSLTIVEAVYFLSQILTTVGYGDITPAKPRGQVFVGLYVLYSLFVIATVLNEFSDLVSKKVHRFLKTYENAAGEALAKLRSNGEEQEKKLTVMKTAPPRLEYDGLVKSLILYFAMVAAGIAFFTSYPGEGKTVFQAIYMSIITLSTVGFGAFTPVTEAGLVFGAFWMIFGSMALVSVVGNFIHLHEQIKARERWEPSEQHQQQQEFVAKLPKELDRIKFVSMYCEHKEVLSAVEVDALMAFIGCLGKNKTGEISKAALVAAWPDPNRASV